MPKFALEELRGKISAGEYAVDSRTLAADMISKFALIRRVRRMLTSDGAPSAERAPRTRKRGAKREAPAPRRRRRTRLPKDPPG